jgi:hypothetical protein
MAEIIPYRFYRDPTNGRTFSLFTSWKTPDAVLVEEGFTIRWLDGTQGCGRKPFATIEEAEAYLKKLPKNFSGMHALGS